LGHFRLFRYYTNFGAKWAELVQLMHKFVQRSRVGNFLQRTPLIYPIELPTHVLGRFGPFCYCPNFGAKQAELVQFFLQRTHPILPIGTHLLERFGPFCNCMNFGAKQDELLPLTHKFMQRTCIGIFATNAPDPPHWTPNSCFGLFKTISLLHELQYKMDQTGGINAQVRATKSHQNFSQRMIPIHPIGPQTHVFGRFGPFRYCTKFGAKRAELVQLMHKLVERRRIGIFRLEGTRSTPLDPKLTFWSILDHFVTARTSVQNRPN
jgi:hypothetical protein